MKENKKTAKGKPATGKKLDTAWIVLGAICIIAALCLGVVNGITSPIIDKLTAESAQKTRATILPSAVSFEEVDKIDGVDGVWRGLDADGKCVGYVGEITVSGFGGNFVVTAGIGNDKKMTGVSVGGSSFSETAGLGAKAKGTATATEHNEFLDQFLTDTGRNAVRGYTVVRGGSAPSSDGVDEVTTATQTVTNTEKIEIDAITSATKTSNAIVTGNTTGADPDNGGLNKLCTVLCGLIDQDAQPVSDTTDNNVQ